MAVRADNDRRARVHDVRLHRCAIDGVVGVSYCSEHHFPRHSHDQFGVGVVESGVHRSWSGVGAVTAEPGDVIMVNPGEIHDGAPGWDGARQWRMLYFDPAWVAAEMRDDIAREIEIVRPVASDAELAACFVRLFRALTERVPDALATEELVVRVLSRLAHRHAVPQASVTAASASVEKAKAWIDQAPEAKVSLAELAALSEVSRFQLLRGFSHAFGITPHAYQTQLRVRRVQRSLAVGMAPAEAAVDAGFADQSHMSRAFVRQVGVTPGCYRAAFV